MHLRPLLFSLLVLMTASFARSDPCRQNFGRCDKNNGLCWGTGRVTHFCSCKVGFKELRLGINIHLCVDVNECTEDPTLCPRNAECKNTIGSYTCTCRCGFVKDFTQQRCLEAAKITGLCNPDANCGGKPARSASSRMSFDLESFLGLVNRRPTKRPDRGRCECETGFALNDCGFCEDIDECEKNPCTGQSSVCKNTEGSYYCECKEGFILGPCRQRCYRPNQRIPLICKDQDLDGLKLQGFTFNTYVRPIVLPNWRNCSTGVRPGDTTTERYDTNSDRATDLILKWTCRGGTRRTRSVLKSASEREARWGSWTCWTACKPTCWGGLQTRMRRCLDGLPGMDGCSGEGSQKKQCYKGPKCRYRVRRDVETLTRPQEADLLQAMERYKQDTSAKGFFNAAAAHGWPNQCNRRPCCLHGARMKFITWHRTILLNYEEGLSRYLKDKTLGIPYWNWLRIDRRPPNIAWQKMINGRPNPFTNMTVLIDRPPGPMRTIQRDDTVFMDVLDFAHNTWRNVTRKMIQPHNMHEWSESLESAHNGPHVSVCGMGRQTEKCRISLAVLSFAGFDPLFMFHHSQVDRLWAVAQKKMEDQRRTTWTVQTALEALEEEGDFGMRQMPFANETIHPFPIVRAVNTMRDSYYYEELSGIKYDNLKNDGFDRPLVGERFLRKGGREVLFVGHYLQSVEQNVYVNYYVLLDGDVPCNSLVEDFRVGSTLITGVQRPYRNSVPLLTPMEKVGFSDLDEDYTVKACYTSLPTCRSQCPEVRTPQITSMPDPILVHYLPNTPIDVYKFIWSAGRRVPNWYIDLDAKSQWVFFFGDRASNIRQVRTATEWIRCTTRNARPLPCSLPSGSCLFPSGIYYLIDSSAAHCQRGLKMIIVSRRS